MASERLFIRCPKCQQVTYLAKHRAQSWYTANEPGIGARFEAFLEEHFYCGAADSQNCPELRYEGDFNGYWLTTNMGTGEEKEKAPKL